MQTFKVTAEENAETKHFKITVGKDGLPEKLGDGNFGMVFAAEEHNGPKKYALKVLYLQPDSSEHEEDSMARIEGELQAGFMLPKKIAEVVQHSIFTNNKIENFVGADQRAIDRLVLPIAFCQEFSNFEGKDKLEEQDVKFSSNAYIMERYESSLKDLVERTSNKSTAGYRTLGSVSKLVRQASAMPVLRHVAEGLQALHAASLRHQDIKPANIYYRANGVYVEFKLGDLGFLQELDTSKNQSGTGIAKGIPIGTKHYRSVEQIDYGDMAECKVVISSPVDGHSMIDMYTYDPKFKNTIIQKGDVAVFAKSFSKHRMRVDTIENNYKDEESIECVKIRLKSILQQGKGHDGELEAIPFINDEKTQVAFFKNPSAKTDLFGLAGILFDIITVGDSPERMYELLRPYDKSSENIQQTILEKYTSWQASTLDDESIGAIFSRVNGSDNLRDEVINQQLLTFLLKCMMSDADDSYYNQFNFKEAVIGSSSSGDLATEPEIAARYNAVKSWGLLLDEIERIEKELSSIEGLDVRDYYKASTNALTQSVPQPVKPPGHPNRTQSLLSELLDDVSSHAQANVLENNVNAVKSKDNTADQNDTNSMDQTSTINRANIKWPVEPTVSKWLFTAPLINKMSNSLNDRINSRSNLFYSMAPEHITIKSSSVVFSKAIFKLQDDQSDFGSSELDIVNQLRARNPLVIRSSKFSNRFEPIWWRHGSRKVKVRKLTHNGNNLFDAALEFADFSASTIKIEKGDYILPDHISSVFVVENVGDNNSEVVLKFDDSIYENDEKEKEHYIKQGAGVRSGFIVKKPQLFDYYGGMFSLYLFHLIISDGPYLSSKISEFPRSVYAKISDYPCHFSSTPSNKNIGNADERTIYRWTSELVIWLCLGGFCYDDDGQLISNESKDKWHRIQKELDHWVRSIEEISGLERLLSDSKLLESKWLGELSKNSDNLKKFDKFENYLLKTPLSVNKWEGMVEKYLNSVVEPSGSNLDSSNTRKKKWRLFS